ncbi:MAG TPA: MmcQ/YjbR family DNA-binding protein [Stackebrandtia sp.]|uniref:MmcQ/YjbR family DNA-binding protein n=1 Tax=Stackebrandtia sp. TaxID=2023065 RepID=UPI002D4BA57D|nr:MmcQ/YjbR family DNA-binding protein [Stackebrandtia sp.]HZE39304.1 MmcQ/YjbR family DNA-binding protein [Stackebrandtia sp.]
MDEDRIALLRERCMGMPEATERVSHGEPAWFVRDKKMFAMTSQHHHDDRVGFWCAAPPGETAALVAESPERFFVPPYVGHRGWLGVYLDIETVDWKEISEIVADAYRCIAPQRLIAELDA